MLELYQAYADYSDIMELVENLVAHLAMEICGTTNLTYGDRELDLTPPWRRASMVELIEEATGERVGVTQDIGELRAVAERFGVEVKGGLRSRQAHSRDLREDGRARAVGAGFCHRLSQGSLTTVARSPGASGLHRTV